MPVTGFEFPSVTLEQYFRPTAAGTVNELGVLIVGEQMYTHKNVEVPSVLYNPDDTGTTPIATAIPGSTGYAAGSLAPTATLSLTDAACVYYTATDSGADPTFNLTAHWIDFGTCIADGNGYVTGKTGWPLGGVAVGDPIIIDDGTTKHMAIVDAVLDANGLTEGKLTRVSYELESGDTLADIEDASLCKSKSGTLEVIVDTTNNTFKFGPLVWYDYSKDKLTDTSVTTGWKVYSVSSWALTWSQYIDSGYGVLNTVSDTEDLIETFGGIDVSNGMALACWFALMAGATPVYWTAISRDNTTSLASRYVDALEQLEQYSNIYSVVPCTKDADAIKACVGYCTSISQDKYSKVRRALWYGIDIDSILGVTSDTPKAQIVEGLINLRKARSNTYRAVCVWADDIMYDGEAAPNFVGAAAAAAMRAVERPHRPVSNMGYDFMTIRGTYKLKRSYLRDLGADGIWIIANNEDGLAINMKQVTTAVSSNINENEESVVANADTIALALCRSGEELVGKSNISPLLLATLGLDLRTVLDRFAVNTSGSAYIGPQILAYDILELYQDPVNLDHVIAAIECTLPKPFNRFVITLAII